MDGTCIDTIYPNLPDVPAGGCSSRTDYVPQGRDSSQLITGQTSRLNVSVTITNHAGPSTVFSDYINSTIPSKQSNSLGVNSAQGVDNSNTFQSSGVALSAESTPQSGLSTGGNTKSGTSKSSSLQTTNASSTAVSPQLGLDLPLDAVPDGNTLVFEREAAVTNRSRGASAAASTGFVGSCSVLSAVGPNGTSVTGLSRPDAVSIRYDDTELGQVDNDPTRFDILAYDPERASWVKGDLSDATVDTVNRLVSIQVSRPELIAPFDRKCSSEMP